MMVKKAPVMLLIMDGFGLGDKNDPTNAVEQSHHENISKLIKQYPNTKLQASGLAVGLPEGQMGNSEVGHLNLGAGRIVYQELTRITKDIEDGSFFEKPVLKKVYDKAKGKTLHLIGLLSDGGVHSHIVHIKAALKGAKESGVAKVYVHALLDGRDVPPKSAEQYIVDLENYMKELNYGEIATISGRYYGMDRDKRWDRVQKAYEAIVDGEGLYANTAINALHDAYKRGETDEFVTPTVIVKDGVIKSDQAILFCNFRPDRARELTSALTIPNFTGFSRKQGQLNIYMATMTKYEDNLPVDIVYLKERINDTLGEYLSSQGMTQLRIAETEKYAHVTYFFNGGEEVPFTGEDRTLVPSPKVATYDLKPEMSAYEVTDKVIAAIKLQKYDMIILNFANPDMVGHTGVFEAAKKAVCVVDECVGKIVKEILAVDGQMLITADHGNADIMVDHSTNNPYTAHTTNPVPLILVSKKYADAKLLDNGKLCDIAPTLLDLAGKEKPVAMSGHSLLVKN